MSTLSTEIIKCFRTQWESMKVVGTIVIAVLKEILWRSANTEWLAADISSLPVFGLAWEAWENYNKYGTSNCRQRCQLRDDAFLQQIMSLLAKWIMEVKEMVAEDYSRKKNKRHKWWRLIKVDKNGKQMLWTARYRSALLENADARVAKTSWMREEQRSPVNR